MTTLRNLISNIILAGYHRNRLELAKLSQDERISKRKAINIYQYGETIKIAGVKCHCAQCESQLDA